MTKNTYNVEVKETLARILVIRATSEQHAIDIVQEMYNASTIVLDSNDLVEQAEITIIK